MNMQPSSTSASIIREALISVFEGDEGQDRPEPVSPHRVVNSCSLLDPLASANTHNYTDLGYSTLTDRIDDNHFTWNAYPYYNPVNPVPLTPSDWSEGEEDPDSPYRYVTYSQLTPPVNTQNFTDDMGYSPDGNADYHNYAFNFNPSTPVTPAPESNDWSQTAVNASYVNAYKNIQSLNSFLQQHDDLLPYMIPLKVIFRKIQKSHTHFLFNGFKKTGEQRDTVTTTTGTEGSNDCDGDVEIIEECMIFDDGPEDIPNSSNDQNPSQADAENALDENMGETHQEMSKE